ncbi:tetratricopeptide repeat protein [Streptomyces sp. NPDC093225]|uniref:tetratricopeptide repeat protein n=1 Tax=Streptomyces sp. NPDC093225 TaxID=3366034 RepID=UPI00381E99ED
MRDGHRSEAERVLAQAVEEEVRRSGGRIEQGPLLARAKAALDGIAAAAAPEYEAYTRALDEAADGARTLGESFRQQGAPTAALVTGVAAVAAFGADLALGLEAGAALGAGAAVAVAGAAATVLRVTAAHWPAAHRRAGRLGQPGGPEQLRLQWLSALEVRGVRPYLEQQRAVAAASRAAAGPLAVPGARAGGGSAAVPSAGRSGSGSAGTGRGRVSAGATGPGTGPQLRGVDRSAAARRRNVLAQSFGQLSEPAGPFVGRRAEVARIAQWVQAARASTETRPVVVVLHGEPGVGRTALAVRAAHHLRDQFRGACVVDLRGGALSGERPLPTREALLHLLNRLGAPREQLLFRERASAQAQVRRLGELYHQHLRGLPVAVVLDDAVDAAQVRELVPERSDSLVLVTAREPLELPADTPAWVYHLEVAPLAAGDGAEVLREAVAAAGTSVYDEEALAAIQRFTAGLPLALRLTGPLLGTHTARRFEVHLRDRVGSLDVTERALDLSYAHLAEPVRRLLRRLSLAGRASLGAAAAAALAEVAETEALRQLAALAGAGLVDHVRGQRYRLHDAVRAYAAVKLLEEEDREEITAAHERLIRTYAQLADAVIRMVDGKTSTRADGVAKGAVGGHGFVSLEGALQWLDDESSFITAALRHTEGVDQGAVLDLLGALCDYCLLRGDLYRLGEINELTQALEGGPDADGTSSSGAGAGAGAGADGGAGTAPVSGSVARRSVQWRTGIAARQLGELDVARTTLTSVVDSYVEAHNASGAARAMVSLGITLHHQGQLAEAATRIREALAVQTGPELAGDRAWALHALASVERDRARLAEALELLEESLALHRESESLHGQAWAHFQRGQVFLRTGEVGRAEEDLRRALELYGRTHDERGEAWALTQLARARLVAGDAPAAVDGLREALVRHREAEDARGEAWTQYYLGQALEERGDPDQAVRELERARTMFSRMRDVYGLACARHHSGRVTRDIRAAQTGSLRNSGFARQLLTDARADFRRVGVAHGEGWTCLELAVVDAGNGKPASALGLCDEALELFRSYGDARGADWAAFLRCTLLPYVDEVDVARAEFAALAGAGHGARDGKLEDCLEAYGLVLDRGVDPGEGWQGYRLGLIPTRHSREVMGVPVPPAAAG